VGIVGWCLLAAALVQPSRQFGAPVDGTADRTTQTAPKIASQRPSKAQQARAVAAYGKLPLGFEANQGQSNSRVRFLSRGSGYLLYLTPDAAVLALESERPQLSGRTSKLPQTGGEIAKPKPPAVLRMQLVGGNAQAEMVGTDLLPGKSNYFLSNDPSQWRTNFRTIAEWPSTPFIPESILFITVPRANSSMTSSWRPAPTPMRSVWQFKAQKSCGLTRKAT